MIVRLTHWNPRVGIGLDEARRAWEEHASVVERLPGLRRYVQHHTTTGPGGAEPPYAGLGEVWFDDAESARAALESAEWRDVIDDAMRFMDPESIVAAWSERRLVQEQI